MWDLIKGILGFSDAESDNGWRQVKEEERWELPFKAPFLLRLPVIRYPRYLYHAYRYRRHQAYYATLGMISWGEDEWVLYAIYRGWC